MPQQQVLEHEILARANAGQDGREKQPEEFKHVLSFADLRSREVLPPHNAFLIFNCAACGMSAQANPMLVMSIPARWDGSRYIADPNGNREPICETCARQLLERFEREQRPIPSPVREPCYFERAYHNAADEQDLL